MKTRHPSFVTLPITRLLFASIVGILAIAISSLGLTLLAQPARSATAPDSSELGTCPTCRPICGDEEISTFEVWLRVPDVAPPGARIPLEVQLYAMGARHDVETLTVTLPAGLEVDARRLPSWLQRSDRNVVWSPGSVQSGDQAGMWFTADLADSVAFGEMLTPTITLTRDGEQCTVPARPLRVQFPLRRLAVPLLNGDDSVILVQNLERPSSRALMFEWEADARAPSRLLASVDLEQGHPAPLLNVQADAGLIYAVDADKITEAAQAAQAALGDATAWQAWEARWQAGEFGWGSALGAAVHLPGEDAAVYSALDAPLEPANDGGNYVLPAIDLQTTSDVVLAVQNVGTASTTATWEAWPATSPASPVTGTLTLTPGTASHISLAAHLEANFQGAVHVRADSPLAVAAVSTGADSQSAYTVHPTNDPRAPDTTLRALTLAWSSWTTELWIHNSSPSDTTQTTVTFRNLAGNLVYETSRAIDPRGTWRLDVSSLPLPTSWTGWVEISGAATLHAATRLSHRETNQKADVRAFLWPPAGTQPAPRTWSLPTVSGEGSLIIANPDHSGPLMTTPMWFDQTRLLDFICNMLQGAQSFYYPSFPVLPGFRGSMIIQARADLSAPRGLTPLSVYLDPEGQAFAPCPICLAGLPIQNYGVASPV